MNSSQFSAYRLLIVPGGNYLTIGNSLTTNATADVHSAVQSGLNHLGICEGGILAANASGKSLNLTSGARIDFYAVVNQGIHKTNVAVAGVGAPAVEHYWGDGPQLSGWSALVGKYPDGTPGHRRGNVRQGLCHPLRRSS